MQCFARKALLLSALSALSIPALAHSPYLLPGNFKVAGYTAVLSAEISLTDNLFLPDRAAQYPFSFTAPDGKTEGIPESAVYKLPTRTLVEYKLTDAKDGTYKLTAGPGISKTRSWEINGETKRTRDPNEAMPAGAVLKSNSESHSSFDAYITIGKPEQLEIPKASGKGLEIVPVTHPNQLNVDTVFEFIVQNDGKPLAQHDVSISYSNMDYSGQSSRNAVKTDASGKVSYKLEKPGMYMATVRIAEETPLSADKPNVSYSKALTFNVTAPRAPRAEGQGRGGNERPQGQGAGRGENRGQGRGQGQGMRAEGREGGQQRGERGGEGRGEGRMQRQQQ